MKTILLLLTIALSLSAFEHVDTITVTAQVEQSTKLSENSSYRYVSIETQGEKSSLAEVIARQPGVQYRRYGGVGSFQTVTIRGVDGQRILVAVDGVVQNSGRGGAVDLASFSSLPIKGVEVYRGIAPAKFGGNSMGGVINIITEKGESTSSQISLLVGSFGEKRGDVAIGGTLSENVTNQNHIHWHQADNDFTYLDRFGTSFITTDDTLRELENNQFRSIGVHSSFAIDVNDSIDIQSSISFNSTEMGVPALESHTNKTALWKDEIVKALLHGSRVNSRGLKREVGLDLSIESAELTWTTLDAMPFTFGSPEGDEVARLSDQFITGKLFVQTTKPFFSKSIATIRFQARGESIAPKTNMVGIGIGDWDSKALLGSCSFDVESYFSKVRTLIGASLEGAYLTADYKDNGIVDYDWALQDMKDTTINWAAHVGLELPLREEQFGLFTNMGRYHRLPSLREKFGFNGGGLPNPNLKDEWGLKSELGSKVTTKRFQQELILFHIFQKDLISFVQSGQFVKAINIDEALSYGVEHSLLFSIAKRVSYEQNLTWQHTQNGRNEKMLPDQPAFSLYNKLNVALPKGFYLEPSSQIKSRFFRDVANLMEVPGDGKKALLQISTKLGYRHKRFQAGISFLDITDVRDKTAPESSFYWLLYPGRRVLFECEYTF